ncbi:hypothetical protein MTO96_026451 [Rhipicephalus appendiculatus]
MAGASAAPPSSWFSTNDYGAFLEVILMSCTRGQARVCHLLNYLTDFNAALWKVGLQLREEDAGERTGDLVVATVPGTCQEYPFCNSCAHNDELTVSCLRGLLRVHRCIVSAEMNCGVANSATVIEALASSSSIRRLTIRGAELSDEREARLRVPRPNTVGCLLSDYVYPDDLRAKPVIPCLLRRNSGVTLTSLDVAELEMTPSGVSELMTSLMLNDTVTELAVGHNVFARLSGDPDYVPFEQYFRHRNAPLKKLTLKTSIPLYDDGHLRRLAETLSSMTTLEELYAQWPSRPQLCEMFATIVFQSKSLRSNLDLDVSWCHTTDCVGFLNALQRHRGSLRTLSLRNLLAEGCLQAVCDTIRKRGLGHRVCIKDHKVNYGHASILRLCPEVKAVTVSSQFLGDIRCVLRKVFKVLATCRHVTSLRLLLHFCNSPTFDSLAAYIGGASTLKEIELRIKTHSTNDSDDEEDAMDVDDIGESVTQALQLVYKALCSNLNIRKLHVDTRIKISDDDCRMFADYATVNNGLLYELSLKHVSSPGHFSRRLVPPFRRNYSLLLLEVPVCLKPDPDMYGAQDVVRRNCGLVERATRFVMGKHDRYGASALELVWEHPKLVENVRREAALPGVAEATKKIAGVMQHLRRMDMHEFMRMTGVVELRVACDHREEDGRTQLDKLNEYCWKHVRQYLKLMDVAADWDLL